MLKKLFLTILAIGLFTQAYAGSEDWTGRFTITDSLGRTQTIIHTPTYIRYMFLKTRVFTFAKDSKLNGAVAKEDGKLAFDDNVETFTAEVAKLGDITDQEITLGPTYPV